MNALHRTTPVSLRYHPLPTNTIFDIIYYFPHGLQVLSQTALQTTTLMGFRYYHHQPYKLLPPWASGITTFNPFQLLFRPTFYIAAVYCLLNCGIVYFHLFLNSFLKNEQWAKTTYFVAELYRLKWNFLLFICSVFLRLNINFKFSLCACVVAVNILLLCPCFSCSIFCYFHHFIDHLSGIFSTVFF